MQTQTPRERLESILADVPQPHIVLVNGQERHRHVEVLADDVLAVAKEVTNVTEKIATLRNGSADAPGLAINLQAADLAHLLDAPH